MKEYYQSLKRIAQNACTGLQRLIGYEPALPRGTSIHVIDKSILRDPNYSNGFPGEFARIVGEIYNPKQKTGQWTNAIGMTFVSKQSLDYSI